MSFSLFDSIRWPNLSFTDKTAIHSQKSYWKIYVLEFSDPP
jgi:hypothetical protein